MKKIFLLLFLLVSLTSFSQKNVNINHNKSVVIYLDSIVVDKYSKSEWNELVSYSYGNLENNIFNEQNDTILINCSGEYIIYFKYTFSEILNKIRFIDSLIY